MIDFEDYPAESYEEWLAVSTAENHQLQSKAISKAHFFLETERTFRAQEVLAGIREQSRRWGTEVAARHALSIAQEGGVPFAEAYEKLGLPWEV